MPLGFGAGQIAKMVSALVEGDDNLLEQILEKKLEDIGTDLLMKTLSGPLGTAQRISQAVTSGGQSEFDKLREEWTHNLTASLTPAPLPHSRFMRKVAGFIKSAVPHPSGQRRRGGRLGRWQRSSWAASRQDWLGNHWRHDWRSQPRDQHGRWVPGRLSYIAAQLQYRGKRAGRTVLRRRKIKRMRRLIGRRAARKLLKGISDGH